MRSSKIEIEFTWRKGGVTVLHYWLSFVLYFVFYYRREKHKYLEVPSITQNHYFTRFYKYINYKIL